MFRQKLFAQIHLLASVITKPWKTNKLILIYQSEDWGISPLNISPSEGSGSKPSPSLIDDRLI